VYCFYLFSSFFLPCLFSAVSKPTFVSSIVFFECTRRFRATNKQKFINFKKKCIFMKNFDLNAYGVSEMNQQELVNVGGGAWYDVAGVVLSVAGMVAAAATGAGVVLGAIAVASVVVACVAADS
jgi:lactobin A/cerein 7B family class IIb bacteriocin